MSAFPIQVVRAAFYSRVASAVQGTKSLEAQEASCAAFASDRGWTEVGRYGDVSQSGLRSGLGLGRMLEAAQRRDFDVLLVHDLARLSRDPLHFSAIITKLRDLGIVVCVASAARGALAGEGSGDVTRNTDPSRSIRMALCGRHSSGRNGAGHWVNAGSEKFR